MRPRKPSTGTGSNFSASYVRGYIKENGTYVPGHYRSTKDNYPFDNWTQKGNVNPFTGKKGTK